MFYKIIYKFQESGKGKYTVIEKTRELTSNTLKIIAITLMFIDHLVVGFILHESIAESILRIPGRIVAPIMCYLIAEGYFYTSDIKKYILRLFIFAIISHFPYVMYFDLTWWKATSVIWGLLLGLIALTAAKNDQLTIWKKVSIIAICCLLAYTADWNYISVLWIVSFGIFRGNFKKQMISFVIIGFTLYVLPILLISDWAHLSRLGFLLTIPLLALYKGRRGKQTHFGKWGFYIFYPAHLLLLYILRYIA